jgi:hypothetical protein
MNIIFEVTDKTGRKIRLTKRQWEHITSPSSPHAYMTNHFEEVKETLLKPDSIIASINDDKKVNFYKYYKTNKKFLKVIVKYLNGDGFIITSYFIKNILK